MKELIENTISTWLGKPGVSVAQISPRTFIASLPADAASVSHFSESFSAFIRLHWSLLDVTGDAWVASVAHLQTPRLRLGLPSGICEIIPSISGTPQEARAQLALKTFSACTSFGGPLFDQTLAFIFRWAEQRGLSPDDEGFPDASSLAVCAAWASAGAPSLLAALRKFFTLADWPWHEGSVSKQIDANFEDVQVDTPGREDQKIPAHRRPRHVQGQVRELAMLAEAGAYGTPLSLWKDANSASWDGDRNSLEALDVLAILSPVSPAVNLAVRVLETHKKAFVQELARARMLLADCAGLGDWPSEILRKIVFPDYPAYLVFQVEAESREVAETVMSVMVCERWFALQELQAFEGVYLRPMPPRLAGLPPLRDARPGWVSQAASDAMERILKGRGVTVTVLTGIAFPREPPYCATPGVKLDLNPPVVSALARARMAVKDRAAGKFFLTGGILTGPLPVRYRSIDS